MAIIGYVDEITHQQIQGWAIDTSCPTEKRTIRIVVSGEQHGQCLADVDRPGLGDGVSEAVDDAHGFIYRFAPPLSTFRTVTIELLDAATNVELPGGRKTLHAPLSTRSGIAPLIVTSRGRTGTTLLMKWLSKHPDVVIADVYPYEIKLMSYYAAALQVFATPKITDSSDDPDFVQHVAATLQIGRNPWNSPMLLRALGGQELERLFVESVPDRLASLFRNIISDVYGTMRIAQQKQGASCFAEKCMLDEDVRFGVRSVMGGLREVVMVRDPRDFLCSAKKFWNFDLDQALIVLRASIKIYQKVKRSAQADTIFIRYEDLILRQPETLASIARHFGIGFESQQATDDDLFSKHATSQSPAASIGRWRSDLAPDEIERCLKVAGSFMEMFGYPA